MILSASRRTDLPHYYSEWFYNRIREGFVLVRNPRNPHSVGRIRLSPDIVDCIVFWTKDPENMLPGLDLLKDYDFYFQFTLTPYGKEIEPGMADKKRILETFRTLSARIGKDRVVWRYDPVLLTGEYTVERHREAFAELARALAGCTDTCVISFLDLYRNTETSFARMGLRPAERADMESLAASFSRAARSFGIRVEACAESADLSGFGVGRASCIDKNRIERITGCRLDAKKDKNQRALCGCVESVDIGVYNTCPAMCRYCYANYSPSAVGGSAARHDPRSPFLTGVLQPGDSVSERRVKSLKQGQTRFPGWTDRSE